jgi:hypothetical protein
MQRFRYLETADDRKDHIRGKQVLTKQDWMPQSSLAYLLVVGYPRIV